MTQETELKPCPFCGKGKPIFRKYYSPHYNGSGQEFFHVECRRDRCGAKLKPRSNPRKAKQDWNTRAEDPTKAQFIDALDGLVKDIETTNNQKTGLRCFFHAQKALEKAKGE